MTEVSIPTVYAHVHAPACMCMFVRRRECSAGSRRHKLRDVRRSIGVEKVHLVLYSYGHNYIVVEKVPLIRHIAICPCTCAHMLHTCAVMLL